MSVRTYTSSVLFTCSAFLMGLFLSGCNCPCESRCTPQGPWQSPTIQATRALLVINTEELRILRIDGVNVHPSCVGVGDVREYHIPAGMHTVTATFRYAAPVSGGLLGAVQGTPLTIQHQFVSGHEYVAFYREHQRGELETEYLLDAIAAVAQSDRYWSLTIADLAQKDLASEPEIREAQCYCDRIHGLAVAPNRSQRAMAY